MMAMKRSSSRLRKTGFTGFIGLIDVLYSGDFLLLIWGNRYWEFLTTKRRQQFLHSEDKTRTASSQMNLYTRTFAGDHPFVKTVKVLHLVSITRAQWATAPNTPNDPSQHCDVATDTNIHLRYLILYLEIRSAKTSSATVPLKIRPLIGASRLRLSSLF